MNALESLAALCRFLDRGEVALVDRARAFQSAAFQDIWPELRDALPPRRAEVVERRYGGVPGGVKTVAAVAGEMGVTRVRVRQQEGQALATLRHPRHRRPLSRAAYEAGLAALQARLGALPEPRTIRAYLAELDAE